jgi:hypothetical protein
MSTAFNITIYKGTRYIMRLDLQAEDINGSTIPYDLTGFSVRSQLRPSVDSDTVYEFTVEMVDILTGKIRLVLPATLTDTIVEDSLVYDVEVYSNTNPDNVERPVYGSATVVPNVTR